MCWQVCPFDSALPSKSTSATWRCCRGPTSWNTKTSEVGIHMIERQCYIDPNMYAVPSPIWILPPTFICTIYVKGEWRGKGCGGINFHCEKWPETDRKVILPLIMVFAFHFIPCDHTVKEIHCYVQSMLKWRSCLQKMENGASEEGWALHQVDRLWVNVLR